MENQTNQVKASNAAGFLGLERNTPSKDKLCIT